MDMCHSSVFYYLPSMVNTLTYSYLSDGTKLSVKKSDGSSVMYRGSFVYDVSASGVVVLESVCIPDGRVYCSDTPDERKWECWDIKDYLGNVRAVVRSDNGSPIEINDYLPYGTRLEEYNPPYPVGNNRWRYAGKELQDFGGYDEADLLDFGSRYYSPTIARWNSIDPQAWNYTSTSPYNYCNNNPVNFVDPNGRHIVVRDLGNNTYEVIGGEVNDDNNIYVDYGTDQQRSIGTSLTPYSFFGDDGSVITGAVIDLGDTSGQQFLDNIMENTPDPFSYGYNARNGEKYDFKAIKPTDGTSNDNESPQYHYRGMPISIDGNTYIFSARDVGNFAAGYVASNYYIPWAVTRLFFDGYESIQKTRNANHIIITREGKTSQAAQYSGYIKGINFFLL